MKPSHFSTSWQPVSTWYRKITNDSGHYYHEHVVIPGTLRLLQLQNGNSLLDLACGTGVLGRAIPKTVFYEGVDIAKDLIEEAKKHDKNQKHTYTVGDISSEGLGGLEEQEVIEENRTFTHGACILAIQNIENYQTVFDTAAKFLQPNGKFVIVLNHPTFRIPRQTSWGVDEQSKLQYRKINRYLSPLKIPINMNPGSRKDPSTALRMNTFTWSFHHPLSTYVNGLSAAGFVISHMEEWSSDKESEGRAKKMENRARAEIPLFLAITAIKHL